MISTSPKVMPYKYIIFLAMLFVTIDLSAVSMAYKMVTINGLFKINSGATFIFPITYALGDIITEVYGYNMARKLIWFSLFFQFVFAFLITAVIHLPSPSFWQSELDYIAVFGSIIKFVSAAAVANIISNFMNIYIVSKLKIPFEGKLFWLRSILSAVTSEFILVVIILYVAFYGGGMTLSKIWVMFKSSYFLDITYAIALVVPSAFTANFLKKSENVDVYDYNTNFNPFKLKQTVNGHAH